ncbi:Tolloid-like protein 1 [Stylophora pistillata]|uniref:Tolloid-like protein 1 n=1 Tax=Stylophora pistillata TaxID=50429 RepID=A0A2B4RBZ0_STYPI|nr:Tolloid-like protein 1 [Stylophora pistillata]
MIVEVRLQRIDASSQSSQLLQAPKGNYLVLNFTMETSFPIPCIYDMYLEVRDGYNKSANLLGRFCGEKVSGIVRSSGQNLWLRFSYDDSILWLSGYYHWMTFSLSSKSANITVEPNLNNVAMSQFVLFNHTSSLWCPAQGAPAPFIVWRKNGTVVQNSSSVMYQLNITDENNDNYSCEVKKRDAFDKKEIRLAIESEF